MPTLATTTRKTPAPLPTATATARHVVAARPRTPATRARRPARPAVRLSLSGASANASSPGEPLPQAVRYALEDSFSVSLADVRVHADAGSAAASSLNARAFTYGSHIFLGAGERPTDLRLMAHEAAHVVQQRGAATPQPFTAAGGDAFEREAERASSAAVRGGQFDVSERTAGPRVQRFIGEAILDGVAELAAYLPGYTLLTVILRRNPINMRPVERTFNNLVRGFVGLIPTGEALFQVLNSYGVVDRLGRWVSAQVDALGLSYDYLSGRFTTFWNSLSWTDIFSPEDVWERAKYIFTEPVKRITLLVSRVVSQAITFLKETFLKPLSNFCRGIPGYTLVTVLLGRDPFTGAPVARTALNVVRAFAEFIPGGTEKVNQLVESRGLQRAHDWYVQETQRRNLTWARVSDSFARAWQSLKLEDVLRPVETIARTGDIFRPLLTDLVSFAGSALLKLLEFIFEAAMGTAGARVLAILKRVRDTFVIIIQNPVGFLRNLVGGVGKGFSQFRTNILRHLQQGVFAWLTGPVARAGVQIPGTWDLAGVVWFVLQILRVTWANVRQKLARLLGEGAVAKLEAGFQLVQEIRQRGLVAALRERVTEFFGTLRETALGAIRSFIQERLVKAGITQLLALLTPVGAVVQAIIKTYETIRFFIERSSQILALVESIVNSISTIAAGTVGAAANAIERTMAQTIPILLDFLGRLVGLGDVGGHVQRTIRGLQAQVDQMVDRAVNWIRTMAQRFLDTAASGAQRVLSWLGLKRTFKTVDGKSHSLYFETGGRDIKLMRASDLPTEVGVFLNGLNFPDDPQATALADAKATAGRIRLITRSAEIGTPTKSAEEKAIIDDVTLLSRLMTTLVPQADAIANPPAAKCKNEKNTSPLEQYSNVEFLTSDSAKGGTIAKGKTPEWLYVNKKNVRWVRMHLIPYAVGGKGDPDNWVPAPASVNEGGRVRSFENALEASVRSAEIKGGGTRTRPERDPLPNVVWVETKVTKYKEEVTNTNGEKLHFPDNLNLKFGIYRPDPKVDPPWVRVSAPVSNQNVPIGPLPGYTNINLSFSTGTVMRRSDVDHLTGETYSGKLIEWIKELREDELFQSWEDLRTRLKGKLKATRSQPPGLTEETIDAIIDSWKGQEDRVTYQ